MRKIKPMPDDDKFDRAFEIVDLYQKNVPPFVEAHLGYSEMYSLKSIWQAAIDPIHHHANGQERYLQAYGNWLWVATCSHNALADQLTTQEVLEYKRLLLGLYSKRVVSPSLPFLRMMKNHLALARALLYEMQWITPLEITALSSSEVQCKVHTCQVRQIPGTDRICRVDCRNIGSTYARQLFHINRETTLTEKGCEIKLTPLKLH